MNPAEGRINRSAVLKNSLDICPRKERGTITKRKTIAAVQVHGLINEMRTRLNTKTIFVKGLRR
jgi:hypothetical protein